MWILLAASSLGKILLESPAETRERGAPDGLGSLEPVGQYGGRERNGWGGGRKHIPYFLWRVVAGLVLVLVL